MAEHWQTILLERYGWYYSANFDAAGMPNNVDIHTHGLFERFNHYDLQICLPVTAGELELVNGLFGIVVDEIALGNRFLPGIPYLGLLAAPVAVSFAMASVAGRRYLRIIYPDIDGEVTAFPFCTQSTQLTDHRPLLPVFHEPGDIVDIGDVAHFILALNTAHGLVYRTGLELATFCLPGEEEPAFGWGAVERLEAVLHKCREICGVEFDMDKIAIQMEVVRKAMLPVSWLVEKGL
ncbi:hypothetical protein [Chitinophaga barathri]|uniref:Uncharacterized protein n=1 Tax=Chitinophaga barathri TaxID=1647451 RepID=A0A3N4MGF5_9BACT|nr:hypothetical protein [Chitinophaga barathri]RPD43132.1 hypothetical protein EG028_02220 [Chitinophaga barathri]